MENILFREVAVAIVLGMLVGLEREMFFWNKPEGKSLGTRTFAIISLVGFLAAKLNHLNAFIIPVTFAVIGLFLLGSYAATVWGTSNGEHQSRGMTTEFAAVASYFMGFSIVAFSISQAIFMTVLLIAVLSLKEKIRSVRSQVGERDVKATVLFMLMTFVILPVLPKYPLDPYGILNPHRLWLLVVLISGISFLGYIAVRILGTSRGMLLTGFFGGLVSSTAVTIAMSKRSKEIAGIDGNLASAIILASSTMFARVVLIAAFIYPPLVADLVAPYVAATLAGYGYIYMQYKKTNGSGTPSDAFALTNPLEFMSALKIGLLIGIVFGIMHVVQKYAGTSGIYLASMLSGLTDVDAIVVSLGQMGSDGKVLTLTATIGIILATCANTVSKFAIALYSGTRSLAKQVLVGFTISMLAMLLTLGVQFFARGY